MMICVSHLYYYPVKSCRHVPLSTAVIDNTGIRNDRTMMVVDESGRFITQRSLPRMALIVAMIEGGSLTLSAPGSGTLTIDLIDSGRESNVVIWKDTCTAVDQGDHPANWLAEFLGLPCRLVRLSAMHPRNVSSAYALINDDQVSFADGFPFLLTSEASLDDLNRRLKEPIPMDRFRPNIVISGANAFEEDTWDTIRIGTVFFRVAKSCARCTITTIDQVTGERTGKEPLSTLAGYRQDNNRNVLFGQNLIHHAKGTVCVGDQVFIDKYK